MLRAFYKEKRSNVSKARREQAKHDLYDLLWPELVLFDHVLSFMNKRGEIDMSEINAHLAKEGRLALPRVEGDRIIAYRVTNLEKELERSKMGILEPKATCRQLKEIDCALIPGIGFDKFHHRLGYGKGFYDKFLTACKNCPSFGVGFREQLIEDALPKESHDIQLTSTFLV